MAKNRWENFWFHAKPWNSCDEHLSLYQRILEFEQKFLPRIRHSIDTVVVPITTKIWQKTARQNFVSMQNRGYFAMNVCLSIDEVWNLNRKFFHAKPWKTNLY